MTAIIDESTPLSVTKQVNRGTVILKAGDEYMEDIPPTAKRCNFSPLLPPNWPPVESKEGQPKGLMQKGKPYSEISSLYAGKLQLT